MWEQVALDFVIIHKEIVLVQEVVSMGDSGVMSSGSEEGALVPWVRLQGQKGCLTHRIPPRGGSSGPETLELQRVGSSTVGQLCGSSGHQGGQRVDSAGCRFHLKLREDRASSHPELLGSSWGPPLGVEWLGKRSSRCHLLSAWAGGHRDPFNSKLPRRC